MIFECVVYHCIIRYFKLDNNVTLRQTVVKNLVIENLELKLIHSADLYSCAL